MTADQFARAKRISESGRCAPPAGVNGQAYDDWEAAPDEPSESTTWEPVDLGPHLRGEVEPPARPSVGLCRTDGLRLLYRGCEHTVIGETESGKTWLALACVAAEMMAGNAVAYIHFEESDPRSTIERLRRLGVPDSTIASKLRFSGPIRPLTLGALAPLLTPAPTLVVYDGINEGMALLNAEIYGVDGVHRFRRLLVTPFLRVGAATLGCDHVPIVRDGARRDAFGSVHKGNALNGARIQLENCAPFGRGMRGMSKVFVTKDRPGHLRANGSPTKTPGITYMGALIVDDIPEGPDFLWFTPPREDGGDEPVSVVGDLAEHVLNAIADLPDQTVGSLTLLLAELRVSGHQVRDSNVNAALADLVVTKRIEEHPGRRGARGYRVVPTTSAEGPQQ